MPHVKPERAVELLQQRLDELKPLHLTTEHPEYREWKERTEATLRATAPSNSGALEKFRDISWISWSTDGDDGAAFRSGAQRAMAILNALIYELTELRGEDRAAADSFDHELWEHLEGLIGDEDWGKVASQACILTESKVREWSGRPENEVGEKLMTAVLGEDGKFPLGRTSGETQGWHRLGMGISMALRNVDTHRIQRRSDEKAYAMGVVGTCSLLLTQLRFEHGNRFLGSH